jgi:hypothetical protein
VERLALGRQLVDLDHAGDEATARGLVGLRGLLPVEQGLERGWRGDVEVVAGDDADPGTALQGAIDGRADAVEAGLLHERRDDRDVAGAVEQREDVASERVVLAAGGERRDVAQVVVLARDDMARERVILAGGGERRDVAQVVALARDDVAHTAARVVHVAAKPRDDVDVEVHHGLAGRAAGVEADVVAVWGELVVEPALDLVDEGEHGALLVLGGAEPVGGHAAGHDEGVAG